MNEMPQICENKMTHLISNISPNEWPLQIHENKINNNNNSKSKKKSSAMILVDDHTTPHHKKSTNSTISEKASNNNLPPPDPSIVLKCPRCDSTNTKFCYYNNYSLSQPRHFCKACKRYWTRGGTLRNVPVGGGCRKHKRVKRPTSNGGGVGGGGISSSVPHAHPVHHASTQMDLSGSTNNIFYGMPSSNNNTQMELNFPFSSSNRVLPGFDHHMSVLGLGFSSTGLMENGNSFFGSTDGFASSSSRIQQLKGIDEASAAATNNNFAGLMLYDHIKHEGSTVVGGKQVKMDNEEENGLDLDQWNNMNNNSIQLMNEQDHHQLLQMNSTDNSSSSHLWNTNWFDPSSNIGSSSVPSLI